MCDKINIGDKVKENFDDFIKDLKKCDKCLKTFGFTPRPVFWGAKNSKIVQISQAPSASVYKTMKPFTDASGKKLINDWYQIDEELFYNPSNFYITALAHCYPGKNKNGQDNTPPKLCFELWIKKEIEYVSNKIYVIIGSRAAKVFFPNESFEELVFKNNYINGKLAIVLPHPSPLNNRWIKKHPEFINKRLKEVRKIINEVLQN